VGWGAAGACSASEGCAVAGWASGAAVASVFSVLGPLPMKSAIATTAAISAIGA